MRIAICVKNCKQAKLLKKQIYSYSEQNKKEVLVDCYLNGEELILSGVRYELIFLEFDLYGSNGFEVAKRVTQYNKMSSVVVISSNLRLAVEGYRLNIFRFILNPVEQSSVYRVLNEFFNDRRYDYPVLLKSGIDTVCLNTAEILYLESNNKHCLVHTDNEVFECNHTMSRISELMPEEHFVKINRAYIINSDYVNRYNTDCVSLKNGEKLRISRNFLREFKQSYHCGYHMVYKEHNM